MRRLVNLLFILSVAAVALAQTNVIIPAISFAGGVLTVNGAPISQLSLSSLTATSVTAQTASFGQITLTGPGPISFGTPAIATIKAQSLPPTQRYSFTVPVAISAAQNVPLASPQYNPGDAFLWVAYVSSPNVVTVRVENASGATATLPAGAWTVKVQ